MGCFKEAVLSSEMTTTLCYALKLKTLTAFLITVATILIANRNLLFFRWTQSAVSKLLSKYLLPSSDVWYVSPLGSSPNINFKATEAQDNSESAYESKREDSCRFNFRETFLSLLCLHLPPPPIHKKRNTFFSILWSHRKLIPSSSLKDKLTSHLQLSKAFLRLKCNSHQPNQQSPGDKTHPAKTVTEQNHFTLTY